MSKVAVLLSGQPRSFAVHAANIKQNLISPNQADVFIHSWITDGNIIKNIINLYSPKECIFDKQKVFPYTGVDFKKSLETGYAGGAENPNVAREYTFRTYSMWYSIQQGFDLIPFGQYDYVVKCRFDCGIGRPIVCANYSKAELWAEDLGRSELVNNWLNFASWEIMYDYCHIYDRIDELYKDTGIWCNEYWIKYIMDRTNTNVRHDGWGLTIENTDIRNFL